MKYEYNLFLNCFLLHEVGGGGGGGGGAPAEGEGPRVTPRAEEEEAKARRPGVRAGERPEAVRGRPPRVQVVRRLLGHLVRTGPARERKGQAQGEVSVRLLVLFLERRATTGAPPARVVFF